MREPRDHSTRSSLPSDNSRNSSYMLNETTSSTQETSGNFRTEINGVHSTSLRPDQGAGNRKRPQNTPFQDLAPLSQPCRTFPFENGTMMNGQSSLNLSGLEDGQWPGGSAFTTDFDLNTIDLFQGADWESLFDVIGQQNPNF